MTARKGRGRLSSIHVLPEAVRVFVDDALRAKLLEQTEILKQANAMLKELGCDEEISRSSLNRYSMRTEEAAREVREAQEAARAIVGDLKVMPASDLGRALVEMIRTQAFKRARDVSGSGALLSTDELKDLALVAQRLQKAAADGANWELKVQDAKADEEENGPVEYTWASEDDHDG